MIIIPVEILVDVIVLGSSAGSQVLMEPLPAPSFQSVDQSSDKELAQWRSLAFEAISTGKASDDIHCRSSGDKC
jgi:hypothetical protein